MNRIYDIGRRLSTGDHETFGGSDGEDEKHHEEEIMSDGIALAVLDFNPRRRRSRYRELNNDAKDHPFRIINKISLIEDPFNLADGEVEPGLPFTILTRKLIGSFHDNMTTDDAWLFPDVGTRLSI